MCPIEFCRDKIYRQKEIVFVFLDDCVERILNVFGFWTVDQTNKRFETPERSNVFIMNQQT